jgi:hypothetical protein
MRDIKDIISRLMYEGDRNNTLSMPVYILSDDETYLLPFEVLSHKGKIVLKKYPENSYIRVNIDE